MTGQLIPYIWENELSLWPLWKTTKLGEGLHNLCIDPLEALVEIIKLDFLVHMCSFAPNLSRHINQH
jgi:hypothetical protein